MDTWQSTVRQAARNTAELTEANRLLLAYQFDQARESNPDGFTMNLYGEMIHRSQGYAVGLTLEPFASVADALSTLAALQAKYGFENLHLGFWRDEGVEYVDVVMVTSAREMALELGRKMEQLAIWDFGTESEIRLDAAAEDDDERRDLLEAA
jgi:hypothetical protein